MAVEAQKKMVPTSVQVAEMASEVATELEADVYLWAGQLQFPSERRLAACVRRHRHRKNAIIYLTTLGGMADTAFRAARCLQTNYSEENGGSVIIHVLIFCKSAGTLMAIGANELVISDDGELGPLDVQIAKPDSLAERMSGLTPVQALNTLRTAAFGCFEKCFLEVLNRSGGQITTATASRIAARLATGLFRPVYAQLDPMRLGEYERSMSIADKYGRLLNDVANNLNMKEDALDKLLADYPSHEFVIDRNEAKTLFVRVRGPSEKEAKLARLLETEAFSNLDAATACIRCLCGKPAKEKADDKTPGIQSRLVSPPAGGAGVQTSPASKPSGKPRRRERKQQSTAGGNGLSSSTGQHT